ncbi:MAG: FAD:protein FMN transferase [Clostridiales bacterium]|nr:FAD:protein FMN transferase [Clostridiales bacterium]
MLLTKKITAILLMMALILQMTSCQVAREKRYEASFLELFDTVTTIVGYAKSEEEFSGETQKIYDLLKEYHQLYDIYNDYEGVNNIKTINEKAGIEAVKVDQKIIDLLLFSKEKYELTHGKLNIAFGTVLSIWHEYREEGIDNPEYAALPVMELLKEKAQHTNIDDVIIDEQASTVYLADSQMSLDVGAIAKGYATQMVSQYMKEIGLVNGMISVGGNVEAIGHKFSETGEAVPWNVGIQNPDTTSSEATIAVLALEDYSLVTSGVYERYYTVDGKQYHHIIDPDTLMPADYFLSVSIVTKDSAMADMLSTSVFNMPLEEGRALIESLEDTEAMWVMKDMSMEYSSGFEKLLKQ